MKKPIFLVISLFVLVGCNNATKVSTTSNTNSETIISTRSESFMKLYIDELLIEDISWEDNDSVKELNDLAKSSLTISMHEYGGFEQTGSIGESLTRNDTNIDTIPGDIVLYQGNQISVFYKSSSWSYTKLGHINLDETKLNEILNKPQISFVLCH